MSAVHSNPTQRDGSYRGQHGDNAPFDMKFKLGVATQSCADMTQPVWPTHGCCYPQYRPLLQVDSELPLLYLFMTPDTSYFRANFSGIRKSAAFSGDTFRAVSQRVETDFDTLKCRLFRRHLPRSVPLRSVYDQTAFSCADGQLCAVSEPRFLSHTLDMSFYRAK